MSNLFERGDKPLTLTVSELNRQARTLLESHFDYVWVEGEISNLATPSSGHWYFSLKDGNAQVRCAMFRGRNQRLRFKPQGGDAVRLRCRVSLYEGRGEFQLIVEHMEPAGAGALQLAFEALKRKLQEEGLFEPERKRPVPRYVRRLAVITSPTGAAIHDILTVLERRAPGIEVMLLPVAVQGENAAPQISAAIEQVNRWHSEGRLNADLLLVGRGGGSLEDLWAFNEEAVARAIAASALPVISAVGHEVDISIADLVADLRAATPSAAAELISRDQRELLQRLNELDRALTYHTRTHITRLATELGHLRRRLQHPGYRLREQSQRVDDLELRLRQACLAVQQEKATRLALLSTRLQARSPRLQLRQEADRLDNLKQRLHGAGVLRLERYREKLARLSQLLDSVSPLRTLERGYSLVSRAKDGRIVRSVRQVAVGDALQARVSDGFVQVQVEDISSEANTSPEDGY
ncbi:MAG: exodeoxyribonuclease VII large subunit [Pseudomonadota bacterium]